MLNKGIPKIEVLFHICSSIVSTVSSSQSIRLAFIDVVPRKTSYHPGILLLLHSQ